MTECVRSYTTGAHDLHSQARTHTRPGTYASPPHTHARGTHPCPCTCMKDTPNAHTTLRRHKTQTSNETKLTPLQYWLAVCRAFTTRGGGLEDTNNDHDECWEAQTKVNALHSVWAATNNNNNNHNNISLMEKILQSHSKTFQRTNM